MARPRQRWATVRRRIYIAAAVLVAMAPRWAAAGEERGIVSLQIENDLFGSGTDRNFTHGTRISWLSPEDDVPAWVADAADHTTLFAPGGRRRVSYELGQNMFAPEDLSQTALIVNDRPYAGWLYGGVGLVSDTGMRLDKLSLNIGVVGPASFAEDVQKQVHRMIDSPRPNGWEHQLRNEVGVVLNYERAWRAFHRFNLAGLGVDITPRLGGALGNIYTYAAAGATLRVGAHLPNDYGPPRIRPSLPGSDFFSSEEGIGWYLFVGVEGRAVARNIFLDGNTFTSSHSIDKKTFVGDLQAGLAVTVGDVRVSYTFVFRTREFKEQKTADGFGSINLSYRF